VRAEVCLRAAPLFHRFFIAPCYREFRMMQANNTTYRLRHMGKTVRLPQAQAATASRMDRDGNGYVSNDEIAFYYGLPDQNQIGNNREARLHENKFHLRGIPNPAKEGYRSFSQVEKELKSLAQQHPDLCKLHVLGKTAEDRPIYALQVTDNPTRENSDKPAVVFKGLEHAREWTTTEVVANSASEMVKRAAAGDEVYQKRLAEAETWFLPVVNPDGLEFSRDVNNNWRKNREPVETVTNGVSIHEIGVDPNRNYGDGSELGNLIYRPPGDKPNTWQDDSENGADAPWSDVYRGQGPASSAEIEAVQSLELGRANVRGVLSYHSFGESILYPFGHSKDDIPNLDMFRDIGQKINKAAGGEMEVKSSSGLYTVTGAGLDVEYINGIVGYTMEINDSFQPDPDVIAPTCERFHRANMTFLDEMIRRSKDGTLPQRNVPERYRESDWNIAL
jgi:zinc carboxypeptidase